MPNYNEPAWKIDLISEINRLVGTGQQFIRRAGGEYTIYGYGPALYPDVLLFRDPTAAVVLQGWELKFPDTPIDDSALLSNAIEKAKRLGLNSFLLWNVTIAKLYILNAHGDSECIRTWTDLSDITKRNQVQTAESRWKILLSLIIYDLNDRFASGQIEGHPFVESYRSHGLADFINRNKALYTEAIRQERITNNTLDSKLTIWWRNVRYEYGQADSAENIISRIELINWMSKFLLAHLLKQHFQAARIVDSIVSTPQQTTINQGLDIFDSLSISCDFWPIFSKRTCQSITPEQTWSELLQFHSLLSDLRIGEINQQQISDLLENTVELSRRELRGQFTTPSALAQLLVRLTLEDKSRPIGDFCCGTGTIPRAAIDIKREYGVREEDIHRTVWASDWYSEPLQLAFLSIASPAHIDEITQIFKKDAFDLVTNMPIFLRNPNNGQVEQRNLPQMSAITSNLPFIGQEGRKAYHAQIETINSWLCLNSEDSSRLNGRSDISAYFIFKLYQLLVSYGRLGIIITNAWLGTGWGEILHQKLLQYYRIEAIITSGAGRWFRNSEVVANILILQKRPAIGITEDDQEELTKYVVINRPISEWVEDNDVRDLAAAIHEGRSIEELVSVRSVSLKDLNQYFQMGLSGTAQFVDTEWTLNLPMVKLNSCFTVARGERRGWDKMFYLEGNNGIEEEYLSPVLKTPQSITTYVAIPDGVAFTCSRSISELEEFGHYGALAWINRFFTARNTKGKPLPEVLQRSNHQWYEMRTDITADLVMFINYGSRLFIPKLSERGFVNQRLVALRSDSTDIDLCHALLNSIVGIFWLEGMGFGRGLGALDLNKDKIENYMMILNPAIITDAQRTAIINSFGIIKNREVYELPIELERIEVVWTLRTGNRDL